MTKFSPKELGLKLRELRKKAGLTQIDMSKRLGITQGTFSQWEMGHYLPKYDALVKLAIIFKTTLEELTGEAPPDVEAAAKEARSIDADSLLKKLKEMGFSEDSIELAKLLNSQDLEPWQIEAIKRLIGEAGKNED